MQLRLHHSSLFNEIDIKSMEDEGLIEADQL